MLRRSALGVLWTYSGSALSGVLPFLGDVGAGCRNGLGLLPEKCVEPRSSSHHDKRMVVHRCGSAGKRLGSLAPHVSHMRSFLL